MILIKVDFVPLVRRDGGGSCEGIKEAKQEARREEGDNAYDHYGRGELVLTLSKR